MGPRVFGVAVVQLNFIVNTIIALSLPEGSVSAITLAFSLMLMPQMAIAQSIAIAAMPTFSRQVATGQAGRDARLAGCFAAGGAAAGAAGCGWADPAARSGHPAAVQQRDF
jgi:hypothetical protein